MVVGDVTCSCGHTYTIEPKFVLTQIPCSSDTYCTDELDFLFYGEGKNPKEITTSLGDRICHYAMIYNEGIDEELFEDHEELETNKQVFNERIHLVEIEHD